MRRKSKTIVNSRNLESLKEEVNNLKKKMQKKKRIALSNEPSIKKQTNNKFFQTERIDFGEKEKFRGILLKNTKTFNKNYDNNNLFRRPKPQSFHFK